MTIRILGIDIATSSLNISAPTFPTGPKYVGETLI